MSEEPAAKACYVGAPAIFALEQACQIIVDAFGRDYGCYLVGSALKRADWRDVDEVPGRALFLLPTNVGDFETQ